MAFAITNFTNPYVALAYDPDVTKQNADVSNVSTTQTAVDLSSAVYSTMRAIFYFKTFGTLTTGDVITITIQVGTGASVTSPQNIIMASRTVLSTDTAVCLSLHGMSQALFESYQVTVVTSSNHTVTYDYQIEVA
jgi:flagellar basal body L-ring protein FlgH